MNASPANSESSSDAGETEERAIVVTPITGESLSGIAMVRAPMGTMFRSRAQRGSAPHRQHPLGETAVAMAGVASGLAGLGARKRRESDSRSYLSASSCLARPAFSA